VLIEESGTTDFGGSLLKYFAAEGVVQGHEVHVFGLHESWERELPGLSTEKGSGRGKESGKGGEEKMKIAWRYERLGEFGAPVRGGLISYPFVFKQFVLFFRENETWLILPSWVI